MRVNFERHANVAMPSRDRGCALQRDVARCDLALPVAELRVVALLMGMDAIEWTREVDVVDAALTIAIDPHDAWTPQERSLHRLLGIVRRHVDAMLTVLRTTPPPPTIEPTRHAERSTWHRGAHAGIRGDGAFACGGEFRMPEGHYGTGFGIDRTDQGVHGYFVESGSGHDRSRRRLGAALLALVMPQAGVGECVEMSWGQIPIAREVDGLRDMAVACHVAGTQLMADVKTEVHGLQWKGAPSTFEDEDDDARDALLARMAAGERLMREAAPEEDDRPVNESRWRWRGEDGMLVDPGSVVRLLEAHLATPEDGVYGKSPVIVAKPRPTSRELTPRRHAVRFRAFEEYCSFRRHGDEEDECAHRQNRGCSGNCGPHSCPLLTQAYRGEYESYRPMIDDDPAFEGFDDLDRDPLVTADHRNTERSGAWRAAGEYGVIALVNQVLHAWHSHGTPLLVGPHLSHHARKAVELGHIEIVEELRGVGSDEPFGAVMRPTADLLASLDAMRRAQREATDPIAVANAGG